MAKFMRHEVVGKMLEIGIIPVFYERDLERAKKIVEACANGGAKVIEFTNRGDFAYEVFAKLTQWCNENVPDAILGVGTVIDQGTAALYINSGANFVVGPILNIEIAKLCNRRKIAYSPGCGSVTEISQAEELRGGHSKDLSWRRGRWTRFREESPWSLPVGEDNANGRRGCNLGKHISLG